MKLPALLCGAFISMAPMAPLVRAQDGPPPASPGEGKEEPHEGMHGGPDGPGGHMGEHPGGNPLEMLSKRLNLTEEQKAKIKPIIEEGMPQIKAIHEEAMKKIKAVTDGIHEKIKPILTPEQQQKLEDLKKEMQNRPHPWGPGGFHGPRGGGQGEDANAGEPGGPGKQGVRGGGFGDRLIKDLNLTPDQQAKVKPILEDTRSKMKALHEDSSLTPDQRREKAKEIREANRAKLKEVLTPEQQQKLDQLRAERHGGPGAPSAPEGPGGEQD